MQTPIGAPAVGPHLEAEIAFRLQRHAVAGGAGTVPPPGFAYPGQVDGGTVFGLDTRGGAPAVLPFNGAARQIGVEAGRFVARAAAQRVARTADQGNFLLDQGLEGVWLFNMVDAQDRDYPDCAALFGDLPVLHYCRPLARRDAVALVPLRGYYSDLGGPNVPLPGFDEIGPEDKIPQAVWRGAPSGTCHEAGHIYWLSGLLKQLPRLSGPERAATEARIRAYGRVQLVASAQGVAGVNAGFSAKDGFRPDWVEAHLPQAMQGWFVPPMHRTRQLRDRYILALEGNDVASGLYWILASHSVALCGPRSWEIILDRGLEPWVHYVPVAPDASSVQARVAQLEADPALRRRIVANAQDFMHRATDTALRAAVDRQSLACIAARQ